MFDVGEGAAVHAQRAAEGTGTIQGGGDGAHGQEAGGQQGRHAQGDGVSLQPQHSSSHCKEKTNTSS